MKPAVVVVIDDDPSVVGLMGDILAPAGHDVRTYTRPSAALSGMATHGADVLIVDLVMPEMDGWQVMQAVRERWPQCRIIILTGAGGVTEAVQAMKSGASDFLTKPADAATILRAVGELIGQRTVLGNEELDALRMLWGDAGPPGTPSAVQRIAASGASVLITGETGVGKEVLADYLQAHSPRARQPYVKVDCPALSETLIESELFGHDHGAFTGAAERHIGRFERAHGGTLFLDEIGDLPLPMQSRLLRVLQAHELERVGGAAPVKVDFRLICATSRDLHGLVARGGFREDLFYRIAVVPLHIPPLRDRPMVIRDIAGVLLRRLRAALQRGPVSIGPDALAVLLAQRWPGNVRELGHGLERACLVADGPVLRASDLAWLSASAEPSSAGSAPPDEPCPRCASASTGAVPVGCEPQLSPLDAAERAAVLTALDQNGWSVPQAAAVLHISRSSLYLKMRKYGLHRPRRLFVPRPAGPKLLDVGP